MWKIITIAALAVLLGSAEAQPPQRPGGGMPGGARMGGPRMGVESDWALLSFELDLPMEQLEKLRPALKEAYQAQRALFANMTNRSMDREGFMERSVEIRAQLQAAYEELLTDEQLEALIAAREQMRPQGDRRPSN